jgi:hypothetical protein
MIQSVLNWFLFGISIIGGFVIMSAHYYLGKKLDKRHDATYQNMSYAFFFWALMALIEMLKPGDSMLPNIARIMISSANTAFLILSFSFIEHGWDRVNSTIRKIGLVPIVTGILLSSMAGGLLTVPIFKQTAYTIIDVFWGVTTVFILFSGFFVTFLRRGILGMAYFSILAGLAFLIVQFGEVIHLVYPDLPNYEEVFLLSRILSRVMLLCCALMLSLSWLGIGGKIKPPVLGIVDSDMKNNNDEMLKTYEVSEDDVKVLYRLAEGESMADIARNHPKYKNDHKELQQQVIRRLAKKFGLAHEKYIGVVIFAIQKGMVDLNKIKP